MNYDASFSLKKTQAQNAISDNKNISWFLFNLLIIIQLKIPFTRFLKIELKFSWLFGQIICVPRT